MEEEATEVPVKLCKPAKLGLSIAFDAFCPPACDSIFGVFWQLFYFSNLLTNSQLNSSGIKKLHLDVNGF